jgi:ribosomal protein S18 acetylase RimI-like enzyme
LLEPTVAAFLAYERDGQAVAAAMTIVAARMAGLYWSATLPAARGRGIADAALRTATNAGFARGAEFAGMQSSAMGESIWRRLGFWDARRYRRYLAPPAQAGSAQGAVTRTAETASGRP